MEKTKKSNSYYLDKDVIEWFEAQAAKENRSASYYVNELGKKEIRKAQGERE